MNGTPTLDHGGYSTQRIAARAKAHRRRLYARLGVSAQNLDVLTMELLRNYAEAAARRELLPADSSASWTAQNSTTRALRALDERLREVGLAEGRAAPGALDGEALAEGRRLRLAAEGRDER